MVEIGHANKKEKYTTIDELRKRVSSKTFNVIVSGNIESLRNSVQGDMGWLINTHIEMVDTLLNYNIFYEPVIGKGIWKSSSNFFLNASI